MHTTTPDNGPEATITITPRDDTINLAIHRTVTTEPHPLHRASIDLTANEAQAVANALTALAAPFPHNGPIDPIAKTKQAETPRGGTASVPALLALSRDDETRRIATTISQGSIEDGNLSMATAHITPNGVPSLCDAIAPDSAQRKMYTATIASHAALIGRLGDCRLDHLDTDTLAELDRAVVSFVEHLTTIFDCDPERIDKDGDYATIERLLGWEQFAAGPIDTVA